MEAVSVRDENSWRIVKKTANIDSTLVCDPVILYGYEKEMNQFIPSIKEYILIYAYDKNMNDPSEYGYIKKYAEKHSFKVVSVGYYHKWCKNINASPEELLGWIKHASMVVTDTFHGTVMSIICNTPVVVKLRGNQNKLEFLLSEYGLLNRAIEDFSALEKMFYTLAYRFLLTNNRLKMPNTKVRHISSTRFWQNLPYVSYTFSA